MCIKTHCIEYHRKEHIGNNKTWKFHAIILYVCFSVLFQTFSKLIIFLQDFITCQIELWSIFYLLFEAFPKWMWSWKKIAIVRLTSRSWINQNNPTGVTIIFASPPQKCSMANFEVLWICRKCYFLAFLNIYMLKYNHRIPLYL